MTFLNPILAFSALACVAIPIVIHILMRKRRRPVEWGAMRFLLEAYKRQRKRLNLEQLLLLASRCLLVALLALAVGKPIMQAAGASGPRGPRTLYILLDNSLTATANDGAEASALERHKTTAQRLLGQLEQLRGDRVAILTLAAPAEALVLPPTIDLAGAAGVLREIQATDSRADLAAALEELRELRADPTQVGDEGAAYLAILSDYRVGAADVDQSLSAFASAATNARILSLRPTTRQASNVLIADVAPLESMLLGGASQSVSLPIRVALQRSGSGVGSAAVTKVRVEALAPQRSGPGRPSTLSTRFEERAVSWQPGEEATSTTLTLDLTPSELGSAGAPIVLRTTIDRDAIDRDGLFLRTIEARSRLSVALLAPPSAPAQNVSQYTPAQWLTLALAPDDDGTLSTRRAGDIAITRLDPARDLGVGAGVPGPEGGNALTGALTGFEAILVPEPQLLDPSGWRRVRAAADAGAAVVVFPPAAVASGSWLDEFELSFGLDLEGPSDPATFQTPQRLQPPSGDANAGLFSMLAGEFEELSKSVGVSRALTLEPRGGSMTAALSLTDGSPLVLVGLPAAARQPTPANAAAPDATAGPAGRGVVILVTSAMDFA